MDRRDGAVMTVATGCDGEVMVVATGCDCDASGVTTGRDRVMVVAMA